MSCALAHIARDNSITSQSLILLIRSRRGRATTVLGMTRRLSTTDFLEEMKMFAEHWDKLIKANPDLKNSAKIALTVESFRQQLERAYAAGRRDGYQSGLDDAPDNSVFGSIFGKTFRQ